VHNAAARKTRMTTQILPPADDAPVSVAVSTVVRKGHEAPYEAALVGLIDACQEMAGYLGATVRRPPPGTRGKTYSTIIRFETAEQLLAFEQSTERAMFLLQTSAHVIGTPSWRDASGEEVWFQPTAARTPVMWRMTLATLVIVYVLVLILGEGVNRLLPNEPLWVRLLAAVAVQTILMSYWLMPRVMRWLSRWIYSGKRTAA